MLRVAILAAAMFVFARVRACAQQLYPLPPQPAGVAVADAGMGRRRRCQRTSIARRFDLAVTEAFAGVHPLMGETRAC